MPEPLGSCALCPMLDYKLPQRWSYSHSGWGGQGSRNPTAGADAFHVPLCRRLSCLPHSLAHCPPTLLPPVPNSWISSQAAANTDALSFELEGRGLEKEGGWMGGPSVSSPRPGEECEITKIKFWLPFKSLCAVSLFWLIFS